MASLAELLAWKTALQKARFSGTRSVKYDGKEIEYRTDAEMAAALAAVDREISSASGQRVTAIRINTSKGF